MILVRILGHIWALPMSLFAILALLTRYFPRKIRWNRGSFEIITRWGLVPKGMQKFTTRGQGFGLFRFYLNEAAWDNGGLREHEGTHQAQQRKWGILYPFVYGGFFFYYMSQGFIPVAAYYLIPFEKEAYRIQREYEDAHKE